MEIGQQITFQVQVSNGEQVTRTGTIVSIGRVIRVSTDVGTYDIFEDQVVV
jgi:hypothetical protein